MAEAVSKVKSRFNRGSYLMFTFMVITVGNSSYLTSLGINDFVNYAGIAMLLAAILYDFIRYRIDGLDKRNIILFIIVEILFSVGILLQHLVMTTKIKLLMTMVFIAAPALLSSRLMRNFDDIRDAAYGVFLGIIVCTIIALIGGTSLYSKVCEGMKDAGFNGGLQHKNYFAVAALLCFAVLFLYQKYVRRTALDIIVMIVSLIMIVVSITRGAWIMTAAFLVISNMDFLEKINKKARTACTVLFILVCCIVGAYVAKNIVFKSVTYAMRLNGFKKYLKLYSQDIFHMWFGDAEMAWQSGETYDINVLVRLRYEGTLELVALSVLIKNGLLGFFGYELIFVYALYSAIISRSKMYRYSILSLAGTLFLSTFIENYAVNSHIVFGIFIYCAVASLIRMSETDCRTGEQYEIENAKGEGCAANA